MTSPILSYPRREGEFFLSTDASDDGLGAVLEQDQLSKEGKVERKVVAYASKILQEQDPTSLLHHQQGIVGRDYIL